ncbi:MAG: hypothetical protein ACK4N5_27005 [Myxococcales bacterium]
MSDEAADDPVMEAQIEAEVEAAVAPYARVHPPELLDEMRRLMRLALRTDPHAQQLLKALRPRAVPQESDKVDLRAFAEPRKKDGTGTGGR